jgi:hypothetical protein
MSTRPFYNASGTKSDSASHSTVTSAPARPAPTLSVEQVFRTEPIDWIKRTGPPEVHGVEGSEYHILVPLNAVPAAIWRMTFRGSSEHTSVCHPRAVRFTGGTLSFASEEDDVPAWMTYIDRWIETTNTELSVSWKRDRAQHEYAEAAADRAARIAAAMRRFAGL